MIFTIECSNQILTWGNPRCQPSVQGAPYGTAVFGHCLEIDTFPRNMKTSTAAWLGAQGTGS